MTPPPKPPGAEASRQEILRSAMVHRSGFTLRHKDAAGFAWLAIEHGRQGIAPSDRIKVQIKSHLDRAKDKYLLCRGIYDEALSGVGPPDQSAAIQYGSLESEWLELGGIVAQALATSMDAEALDAEAWDAEALDAEALDAEALDAEALDAEALDAEALDAEALDAEALDAEALDAEALDAEALDAEALDAEALDAEALDAEALDAEALDAEALDAEALDAEALDAEALDAEALDAEALVREKTGKAVSNFPVLSTIIE
eukprot:maker-scaffold382_size189932-snap-gene-0.27 protein:Tk03708 transcript:maker-scaffold382_size189932-snap-gene-0.27-mRNA-1 annotation:"protein cbg26249"